MGDGAAVGERRVATTAVVPDLEPFEGHESRQAKIPTTRYGAVALLCQRHTQAEVAAIFGVSQMTIRRILQNVAERETPRATEREGSGATGTTGA